MPHKTQFKTEAVDPLMARRVTPGELSAALDIIQKRKAEHDQMLADTVAVDDVVQELDLDATPEEILAEVEQLREQQSDTTQEFDAPYVTPPNIEYSVPVSSSSAKNPILKAGVSVLLLFFAFQLLAMLRSYPMGPTLMTPNGIVHVQPFPDTHFFVPQRQSGYVSPKDLAVRAHALEYASPPEPLSQMLVGQTAGIDNAGLQDLLAGKPLQQIFVRRGYFGSADWAIRPVSNGSVEYHDGVLKYTSYDYVISVVTSSRLSPGRNQGQIVCYSSPLDLHPMYPLQFCDIALTSIKASHWLATDTYNSMVLKDPVVLPPTPNLPYQPISGPVVSDYSSLSEPGHHDGSGD
jgi:hypothetical protein